ncbi:hypothetical protein NGRA_1666 [Nosema granulosis]|uniref:Uncharacterized protein n=1 Tax=Nosema granulosis TaxID=83296 RepID=A0A9P6H1C7_9MICR|nr:hypothetical protein NGRA_1666 [Nosema granulosis]
MKLFFILILFIAVIAIFVIVTKTGNDNNTQKDKIFLNTNTTSIQNEKKLSLSIKEVNNTEIVMNSNINLKDTTINPKIPAENLADNKIIESKVPNNVIEPKEDVSMFENFYKIDVKTKSIQNGEVQSKLLNLKTHESNGNMSNDLLETDFIQMNINKKVTEILNLSKNKASEGMKTNNTIFVDERVQNHNLNSPAIKNSSLELFEKTFYNMFTKVCESKGVLFFVKIKLRKYDCLFAFKGFNVPVDLIQVKKDEESLLRYFEKKNWEKTTTIDCEKYYYFIESLTPIKEFIYLMRLKASNYLNNFYHKNHLPLISLFNDREVLKGTKNEDNDLAKIYLSCLILIIERFEIYGILKSKAVLDDIKAILSGEKKLVKDEQVLRRSKLFFEFAFKEKDLPGFKKTAKYYELKKFIYEDKYLATSNNMSVSFKKYIHDIPFNMVDHIFDSLYVILKL